MNFKGIFCIMCFMNSGIQVMASQPKSQEKKESGKDWFHEVLEGVIGSPHPFVELVQRSTDPLRYEMALTSLQKRHDGAIRSDNEAEARSIQQQIETIKSLQQEEAKQAQQLTALEKLQEAGMAGDDEAIEKTLTFMAAQKKAKL